MRPYHGTLVRSRLFIVKNGPDEKYSPDTSRHTIQFCIAAEDSQAEDEAAVLREFDARIAVRATPTPTSTPGEESSEATDARRESPVDEPAEDPGAG